MYIILSVINYAMPPYLQGQFQYILGLHDSCIESKQPISYAAFFLGCDLSLLRTLTAHIQAGTRSITWSGSNIIVFQSLFCNQVVTVESSCSAAITSLRLTIFLGPDNVCRSRFDCHRTGQLVHERISVITFLIANCVNFDILISSVRVAVHILDRRDTLF